MTEFQPTPIRRSRGPDPGMVVAVVLVGFVALALLKPWAWASTSGRAAVPASPSAPSSGEVAAGEAGAVAGPIRTPDREPRGLSWRRLREVLTPVDGWGIRIVLHVGWGRGPVPRYAEEWLPVTPDPSGAAVPGTTATISYVPRPGTRIVALGVTAPARETPLDVRLSLLPQDGVPERLGLQEMPGRLDGLERLFLPPSDGWERGRYRIDLLLGDSVRRIGLRVVGAARARDAPAVDRGETAASSERRRRRDLQDLLDVAAEADGPAVIDRSWRRLPLEGGSDVPPAEAGAWLAALDGSEPLRIAASEVRGIGLPGSRAEGVSLRVEPLPTAAGTVVAVLESPQRPTSALRRGRRAATVTVQERLRAWPPGTYRVTAETRAGTGTSRRSYVVELLPEGSPSPTPVLLAATRAWARFAAGGPGWVRPGDAYPAVDLADPLRDARVRRLPDPTLVTALDRCPARATIDVTVPVVGLVGIGDRSWPVEVRRVGGRTDAPRAADPGRVHVARPLTGLTLLAPGYREDVRERWWVPGVYEAVVGGPGGDWKGNDSPARPRPATVRFCVRQP